MKPLPVFLLLAAGALFGCAKEVPKPYRVYYQHSPVSYGAFNRYPGRGPAGHTVTTTTSTTTTTTPGGRPLPPPSTSILPEAESKASPATASKGEYGVPVPGRPGYLRSPYSPSAPPVDVRGFSPGSEVRDPENGRVFLVPLA
jgi:hypothetical protein